MRTKNVVLCLLAISFLAGLPIGMTIIGMSLAFMWIK